MNAEKARIRTTIRASRFARVHRDAHAQDEQRGSGSINSLPLRPPSMLLAHWLTTVEALGAATPALPALFVPTRTEPDVRPILAAYDECLLPVVADNVGRPLPEPAWALWHRGEELVDPSGRGPSQPGGLRLTASGLARADIILVPALAVDLRGNRLGQGGGWYDRALLHARPRAPLIAVVFDDEVSSQTLPTQAHDRSVDAVITPSGYHVFR